MEGRDIVSCTLWFELVWTVEEIDAMTETFDRLTPMGLAAGLPRFNSDKSDLI
jgi:hypothetical protein